jgi:type II secretory pathway pseudopilin PulG
MHEGFRTQSGAQMARVGRRVLSDEGMTLPEVMIASSVLLVCLVSLAGLLGGSITSSTSARMRDEAANMANDRLEAARSLNYDRVGVHYTSGLYGDPAGDIVTPETVGSFVVNTECTWVRTATGRAAYKKITVRVSWQKPIPSEVEVTTMIYGKSSLAVNGDLDVNVHYREDVAPVAGATINITAADGSQRAVVTDSAGQSFFGQVPIGDVVMVVTPPTGCIVDTSTLANITVAADAVSTINVYVQRPAQATVHVVDTAGSPVEGASVSLVRGDGAVIPAAVTGADGNVVFTQLVYGQYSASVTKAGYGPCTVPFSVTIEAPAPVVTATLSQQLGVGIRVRVFDVNGTQMPGAAVTVRDSGNTVLQSGETASDGEISFSGFTPGTYGVTVEKTSYATQVRNTTLYEGDIDILDFYLVPASSNGSLDITSRDAHGNAHSMSVIVSGPNGYYRRLTTGASGNYLLTELVPGSYRVRCTDHPASTVTVIVNGGQTAIVSVSQR